MAIGNKIRVDLEGQRDINAGFELSTGDVNAYGLVLEFFKGNKPFDATGYNLVVYAKRSGSNIPIPDVGKIVDGKGYYVIKPSMYSTAGSTQIEIVLTDVLGMAFTPKVLSFDVRKGFASESGQLDKEDYSVLANLIQASQTAISQTESAIEYANTQGQYAKAMGDEAGQGKLQFVIAPANAINKERADLVLTGDNDAQAINDAFTMLDDLRGNNPDIAVRVDFMGGNIVFDDFEYMILEYDNFHIYGNNANISASISEESIVIYGDDITFTGFTVTNNGMGDVLSIDGSGIVVTYNNLIPLVGYGGYGIRLYPSPMVERKNIIAFNNYGSLFCIENSCLPTTSELMEAINQGTVNMII